MRRTGKGPLGLLLAMFCLAGCGGGGGGGGEDKTLAIEPTPPRPNTAPAIISAPERNAKENTTYTYQVSAIDPDGDSISYSLAVAPPGMTIDPSTGVVSWTPTSAQGGEHSVEVVASDSKASSTQDYTVQVQTATVVASQLISASTGGTIEVTDPASELYGAKVEIPPNALPSSTTVSIAAVANPSFVPDEIRVVELQPSMTFNTPVTITIPYTDEYLQLYNITDETTILFAFYNESTQAWEVIPNTVVDPVNNTITAQVSHFTEFSVGYCMRVAEVFPLVTRQVCLNLEQDSGFEVPAYKGSIESFFGNEGKNLLILHGVLSNSSEFKGHDDFAHTLFSLYDNVLFYNYPSGESISENARNLFDKIGRDVKFDIVAHSMGGLLARCLIERCYLNEGEWIYLRPYADKFAVNVDRLFMVGTPNFGALKPEILSYFSFDVIFLSYPGLQQLLPYENYQYSNFIEEILNRKSNFDEVFTSRGTTKYYWFTGDAVGASSSCQEKLGTDKSDGFVCAPTPNNITDLRLDDTTAKPFGPAIYTVSDLGCLPIYTQPGADCYKYTEGSITRYFPEDPFDHSDLHARCATNFICDEIIKALAATSPTLFVSLTANPSSGTAPLNGVDLKATVSGTATGTINYTFYCNRSDTGTNITTPYDAKFDGITENPKTAIDACGYATAGTYTAKVITERDLLAAQAQSTITVTSAPDTTPPDTIIDSGPASSTTSTSATFTFHSTESGSTFGCKLDSGSYTSCSSPKSYSGLATGPHTFSVRATDAASNTDTTPASNTWTITETAPLAPTGVTATAGDGQATISWNPVAGATNYNLYWNTTSPVTKATGFKIAGVTSPYIHTGRTNGVTYYYVVTAVNTGGESAESSEMSVTPISNSPSTWIKTFGGSLDDSGFSVRQTADGGYIVAGATNSYGAGGSDVYLIRIDANGNKLWDKTFGGTLDDDGSEVQQTADGGYIIIGSTKSYGAGGRDVYLIKTDVNGNKVWDKTFGGANRDFGESVKQTTDGGYIISGVYGYSANDYDVYLIRTDADGDKLWEWIFGGASDDKGSSVQQTADGGFIIAGGKDATYTFDDIENLTIYGGDVYLIKTDSYGNKVWEKTDGSSSLGEIGLSVQQIADGGYIVTGWKESSGSFDTYLVKFDSSGNKLWGKTFGGSDIDYGDSVQQTSDGGYIISGLTSSYGAGGGDVYLIKTDSSGSNLWQKTFGGVSDERGLSVQQTSEGGYIITGYTESSGAGGRDIYLIKTDSNGNIEAQIQTPNTWVQKASMNIERFGPYTQEINGQIFVFGGLDKNFNILATLEKYDPATDTWTAKSPMPTIRTEFFSVVFNGKIYVFGGRNANDTIVRPVEEYDPETDTWTTKSPLPTVRDSFGGIVFNEKIYLVGGADQDFKSLPTVEVYDPSTDTWSSQVSMPTARAWPLVVNINDKIIAIGGMDIVRVSPTVTTISKDYTTVEEYNSASESWRSMSSMPTARSGFAAPIVDGKLYIIGGFSIKENRDLSTVEVYDSASDTWVQKASMSKPRVAFSAQMINSKIYALGGLNRSFSFFGNSREIIRPVEEYNPETNSWATMALIPTKRWGFGTIIVDGKIYTIGGYDDIKVFSLVEEYTPPASSATLLSKAKPSAKGSDSTKPTGSNRYSPRTSVMEPYPVGAAK